MYQVPVTCIQNEQENPNILPRGYKNDAEGGLNNNGENSFATKGVKYTPAREIFDVNETIEMKRLRNNRNG